MPNKKIIYLLFVFTMGCTNQEKNKNSLEHDFGSFCDSMETIRKNLEGRYSKIEERELSVILLTAKYKQTQLECYDLVYRGKKRFVEFMYSDNKILVSN